MDQSQEKELVKRIKKLVQVNKELEEQVNKLSAQNEELLAKNKEFEELVAKLEPRALEAERKKAKPDTLRFKMATVLYAEIHGFAKVHQNVDSQAMIDELDQIYFEFDQIVSRYNIEKIKTLGDSYMAAGGIPIKNRTNPIEVVMAALEMVNYIESHPRAGVWDLKIGIHSGQVTATAQGKKKVSYDIKGETVNIAHRMNSSCPVGKVNISVMTYELVKEFFHCQYYGKMPVKFLGNVDMYFVERLHPELVLPGTRLQPNEAYRTRFGLIQFGDMQELILDKLERELPGYLYYHNVKHTIDVVTQVELIGWGEGVTDEEILLLKTAGLFHDAGHTIEYANHEYHGTVMARAMLPKYNYTPEQIETICGIIMATKLPPQPETTLQKIICDADLDYLGRSDMIPVAHTLYDELKAQDKIGTLNEWNKLQPKFLSVHQYFTETARNLREVNKQKQIDRVKELIDWDA